MGKVDIATKQYMSHRDVIADVFNFYIYDGRQVIKPEKLQKIDTAEVALPYGNDAEIAVQKLRDNIMLWTMAMDDKAAYAVLGIENQDKIHYAMAVKNMLYDALQYAKQVEEAKRSYRNGLNKKRIKLNSEEFLSGLKKADRLMPVITLVVYFGDKDWDGAKSIHEMLSVDDDELLSYVPNYKINLIEPAKISDEDYDKFKTDVGSVLQFIKHQSDEDGSWIKGKTRFKHVEKEAVELINLITGSKITGEDKEEVVDMCRAWENSINNAMREGMREGELKGKIEILYEECNMSIHDIARKVSKPEEYVREVIRKMSTAYL
ncbi:MAG: Rpn family recombination-promoting nuclease/putative transposase [Christensenellales bacterium]